MARPYTNDISEVTACFPGSAYVAENRKDRRNDYAPVTETFEVPASPYTVQLNYAILSTISISVIEQTGGTSYQVLPWSKSPASGQVAVKCDSGLLRFNADDASVQISVTYTPLGSVAASSYDNRIQAEIAAISAWARSFAPGAGGVVYSDVDTDTITGTTAESNLRIDFFSENSFETQRVFQLYTGVELRNVQETESLFTLRFKLAGSVLMEQKVTVSPKSVVPWTLQGRITCLATYQPDVTPGAIRFWGDSRLLDSGAGAVAVFNATLNDFDTGNVAIFALTVELEHAGNTAVREEFLGQWLR